MDIQDGRRTSDKEEQAVIERLIAEETDPKVRVHLLLLNRMVQSLQANTHALGILEKEFSTHASAEEARLNTGRGMFYAARIAAIVGWGAIAWFGNAFYVDQKHLHEEVMKLQTSYATIAAQLQKAAK